MMDHPAVLAGQIVGFSAIDVQVPTELHLVKNCFQRQTDFRRLPAQALSRQIPHVGRVDAPAAETLDEGRTVAELSSGTRSRSAVMSARR